MIGKILKYQLHDVLRSKWIIIYSLFFFITTLVLLRFEDNTTKIFISLMNIELFVVPLVSIIFGTTFFYNSKEYITFLLSQPLKRKDLFIGMFLGLSLPLSFSIIISVTLPILFLISKQNYEIILLVNITALLLTNIFVALSFLISVLNDDKAKGLGISILLWLIFAFVYDGIFLLAIISFNDYPLEIPTLILTSLNPIDLSRILILLKTDISVLMGYTGAIFNNFFGGAIGFAISFLSLVLWAILPFSFGLKYFNKKDF